MPFTLYHFGPALLVGVLLFPVLDLAAFMVGSVVLDIEPFIVLYLHIDAPLHGISHTYLVATIVSIMVATALWLLRSPISGIMSALGVNQEPRLWSIFAASFAGTYSHVLLDSFLYAEMNPFFPLLGNPFLGLISAAFVYQFCVYCSILGGILYLVRFCFMNASSQDF